MPELSLELIEKSNLGPLLRDVSILETLLEIAPHEKENIIPLITLSNIMKDIIEDQGHCLVKGSYNEKGQETAWSRRLRANRLTAVKMAKELFPLKWQHVMTFTNEMPQTENEDRIMGKLINYANEKS